MVLLYRFLPRSARTRRYLRALSAGKFKTAGSLLKTGVDAQAVFVATLQRGSAALLQKLLISGADPKKYLAEHPLLIARRSSLDAQAKMSALVDAGAKVDGFTGPKRLKLINWAILHRDELVFNFLLTHGVDVLTADRNGLKPIDAAEMIEERGFIKRLQASGVQASTRPPLALFESLLINERSFFSELHELIKWSIRTSGFELNSVTMPRDSLLRYRILGRAGGDVGPTGYRIELEVFPGDQIALLAYAGENNTPFASLLPKSSQLDSSALRGYLATFLVELFQKGPSFARESSYSTGLQALSEETRRALELLGLSAESSEREMISAYRQLAKRYHPDVANVQGSLSHEQQVHSKMIELNRAYEILRKKPGPRI
jgi:hypothetical protein